MTEQQRQQTYAQMLVRLSRSNFRSRFHLKAQDKQYIRDKGWNTIADHAADFVSKRLAPAEPKNDGKQTPCLLYTSLLRQITRIAQTEHLPVAVGQVLQLSLIHISIKFTMPTALKSTLKHWPKVRPSLEKSVMPQLGNRERCV